MQNKEHGFFKKYGRIILEYGSYVLLIVAVVYLIPQFVLEKIAVSGTSMQNTLQDGDQVLIEKVSRYFDGPERFDIIVFTKQHGTGEKKYIKRVIGLPGETVQIIDQVIFINGEPLTENYGLDEMRRAGIAADGLTLGEGEYFVLGDHRSISSDSREETVGVVKKSEIDGVVVFRIYPWDKIGTVD